MSLRFGGIALLALGICSVGSIAAHSAEKATSADGQPAHLEAYSQQNGTSYFAVSLKPQAELPHRKACDIVILFDTAASETGAYREKGLQVLDGLLKTLGDTDRVQLFAVDLNAIALTSSFVGPRSPDIAAAVEKLRMRVPLGSTDLEAALKSLADAYQSDRSGPRAAVFIGDGRSNANIIGADIPGIIDRLVKSRIALHSFVVGPAPNSAVLAALANQTGGIVTLDGGAVAGPDVGAQLTHAIHEPIIWPGERQLPAEMTEVYPARTPPLRIDRDTILIGSGKVVGDAAIEIRGQSAGKPVDLNWKVKTAPSDDANAYLVQLVDFAKTDGGYSLPTVGSEGLAEARRLLNGGAHTLAELGKEAAAAGNVQQARQFVNEAVQRDPNDPTALVLKSSLDSVAVSGATQQVAGQTMSRSTDAPRGTSDEGPRAGDLLNSVEQSQRLISQKVMTETTVELNHLRDRMVSDPAGALAQAKQLLDRVLRVSELSSEQRADLRNRITNLLQQASQRRLQKEVNDVEREQNRAAAIERQRLLTTLDRDENEIQGLVNRFNSLVDEGYQNFDQVTNEQMRQASRDASDEIRRVGANPFGREPVITTSAPAFALLTAYNAENRTVREAAERGFMDEMHLVDVSHIPFPDAPPIVYPDVAFWRKISQGPDNRREKYGSVDLASNSPAEQKILRALSDDKTTLEFVEIPLSDVINYIKERHHLEVVFDTNALKDAAIDPTALPVSINVHDLTLRSALKIILSQFQLTYVIQDEVLQITTKDKANTMLKTKVYPVADLVLPIQSQQVDPFSMGGGLGGGMMGGGMMGGGMMGGGMMGGGMMGGGMMGGGLGGGMFGGGGF